MTDQPDDQSSAVAAGKHACSQETPSSQESNSDLDATFRVPLEKESVTIWDLLRANVYRSTELTKDPTQRALGETYFPKLRAAFDAKHKDANIVLQDAVGLAAILEGNTLDTCLSRRTLHFDWTSGRKALFELNELAEETARWIPDEDEKRSSLELLFELTTEVHAAISRENAKHQSAKDESEPPSTQFATDLGLVAPQIESARQRFLKDAQRAAQFTYARGMARGAFWLGLLCAVIGGCFILWHVRAINGVGLLAGAVGACASVLQRMGSDTLELNFQAVDKMLLIFGGVRPFIGGVFGLVTFCVLKAGLISILPLPKDTAAQLAFVTAFAFVAGFNERFFQDMLASASKGLGSETTTKTGAA